MSAEREPGSDALTDEQPLVGIVDTSEELADLFRLIVESEGCRTVVTYVPDLKRGQPDPETFLREYNPRVLLWDIAIPYQENWEFFRQTCQSEAGQGRGYVLTTTNKAALETLVGPTPAIEIVGKPFDLEELAHALRLALGRATR